MAIDVETQEPVSKLLGKTSSLSIQTPHAGTRHFNFLISNVAVAGHTEAASTRQIAYTLTLRPWLWLLTRRTDTRVFQNMTVDAILKKVFEPFGGAYRFELQGTFPTYDYKVQYRESDFEFVSRLMEDEGIYYYFEHEVDKHTMVLVNTPMSHKPCPNGRTLTYRDDGKDLVGIESVYDWQSQYEIQSGKVALTHHNFESPRNRSLGEALFDNRRASPKLEVYDGRYAGTRFPDLDRPAEAQKMFEESKRQATLRLQELQAGYSRATGRTNAQTMATGYTFELTDHPVANENKRYLILGTSIEARQGDERSGSGGFTFDCEFTAIDATEVWRPPRSTPKPVIPGPHTALVVGKAGEEIDTDAHGRAKIQFLWDRHGKNDADSSCWVRVSHPWASKGFGMIALPRIGDEVIVQFLEGDPDHPIITGRVYNSDTMPPYKLPDHASVSTIKSRSTKGGTASDFNELRFEDAKGKEYVWLQAQKDFYQYVKNDSRTLIGNDWFRIVKRDANEEIKRDTQLLVGRDRKQEIRGEDHLTVALDRSIDVSGKHGTRVTGDLVAESGAAVSLKSGAAMDVKVGANLGIDAAGNVHIKAGANVVIEAGAVLTLKAGGSSIVLGPTLSITGSNVLINSGGSPGSGNGANPKAPKTPDKPEPPKEPGDPIPPNG